MAMLGELAPGVTQIDTNASYEEALTYCAAFGKSSGAVTPDGLAGHARLSSVVSSETVIKGSTTTTLLCAIHQPADRAGPLPAWCTLMAVAWY